MDTMCCSGQQGYTFLFILCYFWSEYYEFSHRVVVVLETEGGVVVELVGEGALGDLGGVVLVRDVLLQHYGKSK